MALRYHTAPAVLDEIDCALRAALERGEYQSNGSSTPARPTFVQFY
jgi:hypothetical protein